MSNLSRLGAARTRIWFMAAAILDVITIFPEASAQKTQTPVLNNVTDAFINQVLLEFNSPGGAAVAVVTMNDQGTWNVETKGYGTATGNGSRVTENTLFAIGSNSKLFTIFTTGMLIHNQTISPPLSWTSKIASFIPGWSLEDPVASSRTSIIDAMSHRTGLPRHDFSYKLSDDVPAVLHKLNYQRPSAEFRDVFQYNNIMYILLSYLPTLLLPSKIPFAQYVKEHIFVPLGLTSTTYSYDIAHGSGQLADGMTREGVKFSENPLGNGTAIRALPFWATSGGEDGNMMSGAGGVISNAVDMSVWLQTLLLDGVKPGTNVSVVPADILLMVSSGVDVVPGTLQIPELSPAVYGGGQTRSSYRGHEMIEHDGSVPGFNSIVTRLPYDNLGIAVLTNDDLFGSIIHEVIKFHLIDSALGLEQIDWIGRSKPLASALAPATTPRSPNASLPSWDFNSIAGTYTNAGYGTFELCYISSNNTSTSDTCNALASNVSTILPGAVIPDIPTFLAAWDSPWTSHIRLMHWDSNMFNISALTSFTTGNASDPYWTEGGATDTFLGTSAELALDSGRLGLGFGGVWGAGVGVSSPTGNTPRERAEVWFEKV